MLNHSVWKWLVCICSPTFFIPFLRFFVTLCSLFLSPKGYHVFSFTAIRALFVIMQMRKHAGNLIRAQIWFHMKDRSRVGGLDGIILSNRIMFNICFHNGPRLRCSSIGLRCAVVWRLKVTAQHKVWLSFVLPRDAEWKLQLMGSIIFHISSKTRQLVFMHFLLLLHPLNQISKCSVFFCSTAERQENGFFVIAHQLRGLHCAVVCASADNRWLNWMSV